MFSSLRRVFSAGIFRSTVVWQFGPAFLCHVLIVGSFRYMRVYMAPLLLGYHTFIMVCL